MAQTGVGMMVRVRVGVREGTRVYVGLGVAVGGAGVKVRVGVEVCEGEGLEAVIGLLTGCWAGRSVPVAAWDRIPVGEASGGAALNSIGR
jgi:hypothetical protein